jgi:hypothetical protein
MVASQPGVQPEHSSAFELVEHRKVPLLQRFDGGIAPLLWANS